MTIGRPRGVPNSVLALPGSVLGLLLPSGDLALIDAQDYPLVAHLRFYRMQAKTGVYALARPYDESGRRGAVYLHSLLLPDAEEVDHINRDGLDNRRSNLRPATASQNQGNRGLSKNNTSGYKGVSFYGNCCWRAQIRVNGQRRLLGSFTTPEEAAQAYDAAAVSHWGDRALTNAKLRAR